MTFFNFAEKKLKQYTYAQFGDSWMLLGAAFFVCFFIGYHAFSAVQREQKLDREITHMKERVRKTEDENEKLERDVRGAKNPSTIEKIAKAELNLQKPGEEVAVILLSPTTSPNISPPASFWDAFRSLFFFLP